MKKLYIFRGLPGSGKTTLAQTLAALVVEPDMFRYDVDHVYTFDSDRNADVLKKTEGLLKYAMRQLKMPCLAVVAAHVKLEHIKKYITLGKKYDYAVYVVECYGDYGSTHEVPEAVVAKMAREFEPLSGNEATRLNVSLIRHHKGEEAEHVEG